MDIIAFHFNIINNSFNVFFKNGTIVSVTSEGKYNCNKVIGNKNESYYITKAQEKIDEFVFNE